MRSNLRLRRETWKLVVSGNAASNILADIICSENTYVVICIG